MTDSEKLKAAIAALTKIAHGSWNVRTNGNNKPLREYAASVLREIKSDKKRSAGS